MLSRLLSSFHPRPAFPPGAWPLRPLGPALWVALVSLMLAAAPSPVRAGQQGGNLEGFVVDAKSGVAISGATVTIQGSGYSATTDYTGFYNLYMAPAGAHTVVASHADYHNLSQMATVTNGQTTTLHFELQPKFGSIVGRVMQADYTGVANAVVTDGTHTTLTDTNGFYTLDHLLEGDYRIAAGASGYAGQHRDVEVVGGEDEVVDFVFGRCILTGKVTNRAGVAQAGIRVTAGAWTDVTDSEGVYFLYWVAPGAYTVRAEAEGFASGSQAVTLVGSQNLTRDFSLYPAVPNVSAVQLTHGDGQVTLTWTNPTSFADFARVNIYRSQVAGTLGTKVHETTGSSVTTYTDTGLINGKTYYYALKAVDTHGNQSDGRERKTWTTQTDWAAFTRNQVDKDAVPGSLRLAANQKTGTATYFYHPRKGAVQKWAPARETWNLDPRTPFDSVWIPNALDDTVSRINPATGAVIQTYNVGNDPSRVAVDFHGNLWVGNRNMFNGSNAGAAQHSVSRITPAGVVTTYDLTGIAQTIRALTIDHDGYVWVGSNGNEKIIKLDPQNGAVLDTYTVPYGPYGMLVDKRNHLWIFSNLGYLMEFDIAQEQVVWQQAFNSYIISIDPDGYIWASGNGNQDVRRIDPITHEITTHSLTASEGTSGISIDREGTTWATDYNLGRVWRLRASDGFVYGIYPAGYGPVGAVPGLDGDTWVSCREANRVFRLSASGRVKGKTRVGHWPYNYTQMTVSTLLYSTHTRTVEYSLDGETWTTDLAQVPASEGLYLRVNLGTSHTAVSPLLEELQVQSLPQYVGLPQPNAAPELLAVVAPNGGERWLTLRPERIRWSSHDPMNRIAQIKLFFEMQSGGGWTEIATGQANDGVHRWTLPQSPSETVRLKIEGYDSNGTLLATDVSDADFAMVAWGRIAGTVTDSRNGSPVAGATVSVVLGDGPRTATSNAAGAYALEFIPVGSYSVTATKSGFAPLTQSVSVVAEETATLNFDLGALGQISGTVREVRTNVPVRGVTVSDGTRTATSGADGTFTLAAVPPGEHTVSFSRSGYAPENGMTTVNPGQTAMLNANLTPLGTGRVTGTVRDQVTGAALAGVTVQADTFTTTTDAAGGYTLADLPPNTYTVTASKTGYDAASTMVTVNATEVTTADLQLDQGGADIQGTVTASGEFGFPLYNALVTAGPYSAVVDETGTYRLRNLPPGTYTVTASAPDYLPSSQSVTITGNETVTRNFILGNRVGRILGTLTDNSYYTGSEGSGMGYISVTDGTRTVQAEGNSYTLAEVPPGTYTVVARSMNGVGRGTAVVVAGQDTVLNLTLTSTGVSGIVYSRTPYGYDEPLQNARVAIGEEELLTDQDGKYFLPEMDPGSYKISAWKAGHVRQTRTTTVVAEQVTTENFYLQAPVPNVTALSVTNGDTQVTLSWTNPPTSGMGYGDSFTHHHIYRSTVPGTLGTLVAETADTTTTSYVDPMLENGKTYYYTVKCADSHGTESDARVVKTWSTQTDFADWTLTDVSRTLVSGVLRLDTGDTSGSARVQFRPRPGMVLSAPQVDVRRSWDPRPYRNSIFVPGTAEGQAHEYSASTGALLGTYSVGTDPSRMALARNGDWWVANRGGNSVSRIRKQPNGMTTVDTYPTGRVTVRGLAVDRDGYVWAGHTGTTAADYHDNQLVKIDPETGQVIKFYYMKRCRPYGMLADWSGENLWITDATTRNLIQFSLTEQRVVRRYNISSYGMCIDREERLWTVGLGPYVYRVDPRTQEVTQFQLPTAYGGYYFQSGTFMHVLVNRANHVFVTWHDGEAVLEYQLNSTGDGLVYVREHMVTDQNVPHGPRALVEDRDGFIWSLNSSSGTLTKFDANGSVLEHISTGATQPYSHMDHNGFNTRPAGVDLLERYSADGTEWKDDLGAVPPAEGLYVRVDLSAPAPAMGEPALSPTVQEVTVSALGQYVGVPSDTPSTPWAAVVGPNGGEALPKNSTYPIRWATTDPTSQIATVALRFSSDDGQNWSLIADGLPNTGAYHWTVPSTNTTTARIKVEAYDANSTLIAMDRSDAVFTIGPSGSITGTVTNSLTQQPLAGVTVASGAVKALTNAQGVYTLAHVPAQTQTVTAKLWGHTVGSQSVTVTDGNTATANYALTPVGRVGGIVKDVDSGAAIAGATVTAGAATATTNALGQYLFPELTAGTYTLSASHTYYTTGTRQLTVNLGDVHAEIDFTLKGKGTLGGTIIDQVTSTAIEGATVTDGTRSAMTNASGAFTIPDVPTGSYTVSASAAGYRTASQQANTIPGQTTTTNFALVPVGTVSGIVTDADGPVEGVTIAVGTQSTTTNASGEYTLADLPTGSREVTARRSGHVAQTVTVTVVRGQTATQNFTLIATGTLSGFVKDAETEELLNEAQVTDGTRTAVTGAQSEMSYGDPGFYSLSDVPPGTYVLTCRKNGYIVSRQTVEVRAKQTTTAHFRLLPAGEIVGTVTDTNSAPLAGVEVEAGTYVTTTGVDGVYRLPEVAAGTYTVRAYKAGYATGTQTNQTVVKGQVLTRNFSLAAAETGLISGVVRRSDTNAPVRNATVTVGSLSITTRADGRYTLTDVPAGMTSATAAKAGFTDGTQNVTVVAGERATRDFALVKSDNTAPTVTDLTPANGATTRHARAPLSATVSDGSMGSGVDPSTVELRVNHVPVAHTYNFLTGKLTYTPPTDLVTSSGTVPVSIRVQDNVGNETLQEWSFTCDPDTSAPYVDLTGPADDTTLTNAGTLTGSVYDGNYPLTYYVKLKPADGTKWYSVKTGTIEGQIFSGEITTLDTTVMVNGKYVLRLEVVDQGGNRAHSDKRVLINGTLKVGQFTRTEAPDLSVPYPGAMPFQLVRTYNSHLLNDTPFGPGWAHNLHASLVEETKGTAGTVDINAAVGAVIVALPDGNRAIFNSPSSTGGVVNYTPPAGSKETLTRSSYLDEDDNAVLTYRLKTKDGSVFTFTAVQGDRFTPGATNKGVLKTVEDRFSNKILVSADENEFTDTTGRKITLVRDGEGRVEQVTYTSPTADVSKTVQFSYSASAPEFRVSHSAANAADHNGNLTTVTSTTEYHYQEARFEGECPRLSKVVLPNQSGGGQPVLEVVYDLSGRMERQKTFVTASLFTIADYAFDPATHKTVVTSKKSDGTVVSVGDVTQNSTGAPLSGAVQPAGAMAPVVTNESIYGDTSNPFAPTQTKETAGGVDRYQGFVYQSNGNLTEQKAYRGLPGMSEAHVQIFQYESTYNQPASTATTQGYDGMGSRVETLRVYAQADGMSGSAAANKYLAQEKVLLRDPDGTPNSGDEVYATTGYIYDNQTGIAVKGLVTESVAPDGVKTLNTYNQFGQVALQQARSADGTRTTPTSRTHSDSLGRTLLSASLSGGVTRTEYDSLGRLYRVRTYKDTEALTRTDFTPATYDSFTVLAISQYGYDKNSQQTLMRSTSLIDGEYVGSVLRSEYAVGGRLVSTARYVYQNGTETLAATVSNTYDDFGRKSEEVREEVLPNNATRTSRARYFYDNIGHLTDEKHYAFGSSTIVVKHVQHEFYDNGLKKRERVYGGDGTNKLTETFYEYDEFKRPVRTTEDPGGKNLVTEIGYDAAGNRIVTKDAKGTFVFSRYDNANRLVDVSFPLTGLTVDMAHPTWPTSAKARFHYDYFATGETQKDTLYDVNGSTVLAWKEFTYDEMGRLTSVTQPVSTGVTTVTAFEYRDPGQNPWTFMGDTASYTKKITDAEGKAIHHALDGAGRLIKIRHPDGMTEEKDYFDNGSPRSLVVHRPNGQVERIYYRYTADGKLYRKYYGDPANSMEFVEYEYDTLDRRTAVVDNRAAAHKMGGLNRMEWKYDDLGRIKEAKLHDGRELHYEYTATGQRTRIQVKNSMGATEYDVTYDYDSADRLHHVYEGGNTVATYGWDANGNRESLTYNQVGSVTTAAFDLSNRLTQLKSSLGMSTLAQFDFTVDALGRRTQIKEQLKTSAGTTASYTVQYTYDQLSRMLTENRVSGGTTLVNDVYAFDKVGNRVTKNGSTYSYLASSDKLGGDPEGNSYTFDSNGNQLTKGQWAYEYDWDNQLKKATAPDGKVIEFWYDPDGNRIRKSVTANQTTTTTQYVVDMQQPYAQVVLELDGAGAIIAKYVYGDDLLKVSRSGDYYYFYDGLGSTRAITNSAGVVQNRYTYDAYGTLLANECEHSIANEYLFTGERVDPDTGLVYLRARYYDPLVGRFLQLDTYFGTGGDPGSLHRYLYVKNDPANYIDPSGHLGLVGQMAASFAHSALRVLTNPYVNIGLRIISWVGIATQLYNAWHKVFVDHESLSAGDVASLAFSIFTEFGLAKIGKWAAAACRTVSAGGRVLNRVGVFRNIRSNLGTIFERVHGGAETGLNFAAKGLAGMKITGRNFSHYMEHLEEYINPHTRNAANTSFWPKDWTPVDVYRALKETLDNGTLLPKPPGMGATQELVQITLDGKVFEVQIGWRTANEIGQFFPKSGPGVITVPTISLR